MARFDPWRMSLAACAAGVLLALGGPAAAQSAALVSGDIFVHGCRPASVPQVRAIPVMGTREANPPSAVIVDALPAGGGSWRFELRGLDPGHAWRVGVRLRGTATLPPAACGGLRWSADREPVVLPGADGPLRFDGYALRGQIEVRADQTVVDPFSDGRPEWVGADVFDPFDPAQSVRTLRWRSDVPGIEGGQVQVSLTPFPRIAEARYDPCAKNGRPVEPLWSQDVAAVSGRWTEVTIDFNALLVRRAGLRPGALAEGGDAAAVKLELGQPVYVRVLPLVRGAPDCRSDRHGVPPEVILAKIGKLQFTGPPSPDPTIRMVSGAVYFNPQFVSGRPDWKHKPCYRLLADHKLPPDLWAVVDPWDLIIISSGAAGLGKTMKKGQWFCQYKGSSDESWFDSAIDSVGAVLSAVVDKFGQVVDFTSSAWESIQDAVVAVAGDVISATGIVNCGKGSPCEAALEAGLEIALASMGVPPSLPNFDQLVDQGFDYMAAQVASQVGAPDVVADYASAKAQEFVKTAAQQMRAQHGHPKLPAWLEPTLNFEPASIVLSLRGAGKAYPYASTPLVIRKNALPYVGATLALPRMLPGESEPPMKFPMTLPPDLYGLPAPPKGYDEYSSAYVDKENWLTLRYGACYRFFLVALSTPGGVQNVADFSFQSKTAQACTP